jgi:hypothetical protein
MERFNLQQVRQQIYQQIQERGLPPREVFRLDLIAGDQALDKRKGRGLNGGNTAYARGTLNNDYIDNVRCRNLFTNTITFINSSNAVNMGAGSLIEKTSNQGFFGVAIGNNAGEFSQGDYAIAIGTSAGQYSQGDDTIAIGSNAGFSQQGESSIAIGNSAGSFNQQSLTIAIGNNAGYNSQQQTTVAIGLSAGYTFQGTACVAIGTEAGKDNQGKIELNQGGVAVAIGRKAGSVRQGEFSVAVGRESSLLDSDQASVNIGMRSGAIDCSTQCVNVGTGAGEYYQARFGVAVGKQAGNYRQELFNSAIGYQAGYTNQIAISEAIGFQAGYSNQISSTAIGYQSGLANQGAPFGGAIAIGYQAGITNQHQSSIIINATNTPVNSLASNTCYINPIRQINTGTTVGMLSQNSSDTEVIFYSNAVKTFVIQHPLENDKYLSHACVEGPSADVFYRGTGEIKDTSTQIMLPDFAPLFLKDFNIQISPVLTKNINTAFTNNHHVEHNDKSHIFTVHGPPGKFSYLVHATREEFEVEPLKNSVKVKGEGPYTFIQN